MCFRSLIRLFKTSTKSNLYAYHRTLSSISTIWGYFPVLTCRLLIFPRATYQTFQHLVPASTSSNWMYLETRYHTWCHSLSLCYCQIEGLPDSSFWSSLTSLKILYLHGNLIKSKECLLNLSSSPQLQILTMYDNPVSFISNYRHIVVNWYNKYYYYYCYLLFCSIVTLKAVDRHVISDEEIIENFHPWGKFKSLARSFKMPLYITVDTVST